MWSNDLCAEHCFYCILCVVVCVMAKEERSLASVELLARGLLINFEHPLNFLTLLDCGSSKYQAIIGEK